MVTLSKKFKTESGCCRSEDNYILLFDKRYCFRPITSYNRLIKLDILLLKEVSKIGKLPWIQRLARKHFDKLICLIFLWMTTTLFQHFFSYFNSLPNNKILDWSKLKAFSDDKLKVAKIMISVFDGIENIVGKGENSGCQHFLLFPQCFQNVSSSRSLKFGIVW